MKRQNNVAPRREVTCGSELPSEQSVDVVLECTKRANEKKNGGSPWVLFPCASAEYQERSLALGAASWERFH